MSKLLFLPWLRYGHTASITTPFSTSLLASPSLALEATLDSGQGTKEISKSIPVQGPGHVKGLPADAILRRVPAPAENRVPIHHFAQVELFPAWLPWIATPAAPLKNRLPPWMVLVVVRADRATLDGEVLVLPPGQGKELPELSESWAWAHVQLKVEEGEDPATVLSQRPEASCARLCCPRRLEPGASWIAAIVPAFAAGVQAGLGMEVKESTLARAWDRKKVDAEGIRLPTYARWQFRTVSEGTGDFEDLARQIKPIATTLAPSGQMQVQVFDNGSTLLASTPRPSGRFVYRGALAPAVNRPAPSEDNEVAASLQATWKPSPEPTLCPPVIGAPWLATDPVLPLDAKAPAWIRAINLDPALRAAASLGAAVVRRNQERFVAEARAQTAGILEANQQVRQSAFAAEVGKNLSRKLQALPSAELLQVSRPMHATRSAPASGLKGAGLSKGTFTEVLVSSSLPTGIVSGALRRCTRPAGPTGRKLKAKSSASTSLFQGFLSSGTLQKLVSPSPTAPDSSLSTLGDGLKSQLQNRSRDLETHLQSRLTLSDAVKKSSLSLRTLRARPRFTEPLAHHLSPALLLPRIEEMADNSVVLLQQDRAFIAAVLAGANDAMARELVWRELPIDPAWTFFRHFWPRPEAEGNLKAPMAEWKSWPPAGPGTNPLIFLIKSALLRRFPGTRIYGWNESGVQAPLFSGELALGLRYVGFQNNGTPWSSWRFVLEQPSEQPVFGLDGGGTGTPTRIDDLAWEHLGVVPGDFASPSRSLPPLEGLTWGSDAGVMARLCLQKPIRLVLPATTWIV